MVAKTEGSEYGIFASNGRPEVSSMWVVVTGWPQLRTISLEDAFVVSWPGCMTGRRSVVHQRQRVGRSSASGNRLTNMLPLVVGGDVAEDGSMMSPFEGRLEEVPLSKVARYTQDFA